MELDIGVKAANTRNSPSWHTRARKARQGARQYLKTCSVRADDPLLVRAVRLLQDHHGTQIPRRIQAAMVWPRYDGTDWACQKCGYTQGNSWRCCARGCGAAKPGALNWQRDQQQRPPTPKGKGGEGKGRPKSAPTTPRRKGQGGNDQSWSSNDQGWNSSYQQGPAEETEEQQRAASRSRLTALRTNLRRSIDDKLPPDLKERLEDTMNQVQLELYEHQPIEQRMKSVEAAIERRTEIIDNLERRTKDAEQQRTELTAVLATLRQRKAEQPAPASPAGATSVPAPPTTANAVEQMVQANQAATEALAKQIKEQAEAMKKLFEWTQTIGQPTTAPPPPVAPAPAINPEAEEMRRQRSELLEARCRLSREEQIAKDRIDQERSKVENQQRQQARQEMDHQGKEEKFAQLAQEARDNLDQDVANRQRQLQHEEAEATAHFRRQEEHAQQRFQAVEAKEQAKHAEKDAEMNDFKAQLRQRADQLNAETAEVARRDREQTAQMHAMHEGMEQQARMASELAGQQQEQAKMRNLMERCLAYIATPLHSTPLRSGLWLRGQDPDFVSRQ